MLEMSHVDAFYGNSRALQGINLSVGTGEFLAVLGRNGVGKTSTLRAILGLIHRRGEVRLAGERIDALPTHRIVQRGVGYVPEDREVFAGLTVAENLALAERRSRRGAADADRLEERRELVAQLFPDLVTRRGQAAGTLSGGQQQMVSVARALLNDNRLLLVDEPTKGLAPRIVGEVADALREASRLVPILLVEQNLEVVRALAGDAIVIESGRVVHTGSATGILDDEELTRRLLGVHAEAAA